MSIYTSEENYRRREHDGASIVKKLPRCIAFVTADKMARSNVFYIIVPFSFCLTSYVME